MENHGNFNQRNLRPGQNLNRLPLENKLRALTVRLIFSILFLSVSIFLLCSSHILVSMLHSRLSLDALATVGDTSSHAF